MGNNQDGSIQYTKPEIPPIELHLRRMFVTDALEKLHIYLEDASLAGLNRVRIIHGKGTGVLKEAVIKALIDSPLVSEIHMADPSEGGGGVTVAKLKYEVVEDH